MDSGSISILLILIFGLVVPFLAFRVWGQLRKSRAENDDLQEQLKGIKKHRNKLSNSFKQLVKEIEPLRQYQAIEDVQQEINLRKSDMVTWVKGTKDRGELLLEEAKKEARIVRAKAKESAERSEQKSVQLVQAATKQSDDIHQQAEQKAQEIAGDALEAMGRAQEFTRTAKAMKNLIEGYGDEYLIPNQNAIDDLADEFDHKQAGQELKSARSRSKDMIKHGTAADCDYVEPYRRKTAIEFVLDAFNGKVESILSTVRHNNFGKLEQSIKDAYQTVNHNGQAFRNARINELYLTTRLRELKWAVAANELKLQEREEQRQIREQMREEEKARREIEKAIKDAEKEERLLKKAMAAARKELGSASEEERAKLEQQLAELQQKYDEAEDKNQRALSMAQQTRRGHVYVISNEGSFGEQVYKIGMTRRLEPMDRVKELGDASVPFPFDVHAIISTEDAPALENELHKRFDHARLNKVNLRKEYFNVTLAEVRQIVEEKEIEARWTMSSEAAEYRESKAIAMQEHKEDVKQLA